MTSINTNVSEENLQLDMNKLKDMLSEPGVYQLLFPGDNIPFIKSFMEALISDIPNHHATNALDILKKRIESRKESIKIIYTKLQR